MISKNDPPLGTSGNRQGLGKVYRSDEQDQLAARLLRESDPNRANCALNFFERCLKHGKGEFAGKPFLLMDWQLEIICDIFGTLDQFGHRQYQKAYIEVPKKNGKSELAAGVALYCLIADQEPGAEVYSAAASKDQAALVYKVAASM